MPYSYNSQYIHKKTNEFVAIGTFCEHHMTSDLVMMFGDCPKDKNVSTTYIEILHTNHLMSCLTISVLLVIITMNVLLFLHELDTNHYAKINN